MARMTLGTSRWRDLTDGAWRVARWGFLSAALLWALASYRRSVTFANMVVQQQGVALATADLVARLDSLTDISQHFGEVCVPWRPEPGGARRGAAIP